MNFKVGSDGLLTKILPTTVSNITSLSTLNNAKYLSTVVSHILSLDILNFDINIFILLQMYIGSFYQLPVSLYTNNQ